MDRNQPRSYFGLVVILGSVWGLAECLLGATLNSCASTISGSVMTGVALFFIASTWSLTRSRLSIVGLIFLVSLFKMFDAVLLGLPLRHGAVANPIFAFILEGAAFLALASLFTAKAADRKAGQALLGGSAALTAAFLFPLVRYATGIPACLAPGTGIPLSVYYAPLAFVLSLLTVPLGEMFGARIKAMGAESRPPALGVAPTYTASILAMALCLMLIALFRIV